MDRVERRAQLWPAVERFFGGLPAGLQRPALILRHSLATAHSPTGQLGDLLTRPGDWPALDLHLWLLDDWRLPDDSAREQIERRVFQAAFYRLAAAFSRDRRASDSPPLDGDFTRLEEALEQQAGECLAAWPSAAHETADGFPLAFVAGLIGRAAHGPALAELQATLASVHGVYRDVTDLRRDLGRGCLTPTVERALRAAALPLSPPFDPARALAALALTGVMRQVHGDCRDHLARARGLAQQLRLPTFEAWIQAWMELMDELAALIGLRPAPGHGPARVTFTPQIDHRALALDMAARCLSSDPELREAWEVQRRGVFGEPELIGRAFGPGLIAEWLCPLRADGTAAAEAALRRLIADGFRYYPHPRVPPDADDLGLALRLWQCLARPEAHRMALEAGLRRLQANLPADGRLPIWFARRESGEPDGQVTDVRWGEGCLTVEANLLLGLMDYDAQARRGLLERGLRRWIDRWLAVGLGGNSLWAPHYALWAAGRLLARLDEADGADAGRIGRAREVWLWHLQTETAEGASTPQAAALLTLICQLAPARGLARPEWARVMLGGQRYDGAWRGEPLYVTPTRGEGAAWYASDLATTALCWRALA